MKLSLFPMMILATLLIIQTACQVNPNTHETTGPQVSFRQGDSTLSSLFLSAGETAPINFSCAASDPGGVASINLEFSQDVAICVFSSGCGSSICPGNSGRISPAMPALQAQTSHPDSSGRVPNDLFLLATLQGPYSCVTSNHRKTATGKPYGQTVTATCTATNYSKLTTKTTLPITFSPPSDVSCCTGSSCACGAAAASKSPVAICCAGTMCQSSGTSCK